MNKDAEKIIKTLRNLNIKSTSKVAFESGLNYWGVQNLLKKMKRQGIVEEIPSGKITYWRLVKKDE